MRVLLKLTLDCHPDAAWHAIRTPKAFRQVSAPFTSFSSLEDGGFPETWSPGEHPVEVSTIGGIVLGEQLIDISFAEKPGVRIVHDDGRGLTGQLALVTKWHHTMAISHAPDGKTLYRDRLVFGAGAITPLLWPVYWAFWQWRGIRIKALAKSWR